MLTNKEIATALVSLKPNVVWTMNGDDYENIIWNSEEPKPTLAELETEVARLATEEANAIAAAVTAKEAAYTKLAALGLTAEEIAALSK